MHNRLIEFVERFEILHHSQFVFRKKHSTSLTLVHLTNKIDRKELTAGVFLDLSKAFDTLHHEMNIMQAQPGVLGIWYLECFLTRYSVFFLLNYGYKVFCFS